MLLEKGSVGGVQVAIFLKGLSEKFSSSRKSKCSLSTDEVWKKAFVLTFHYDPSYLYHSGLDSILLSQVLSVPVKCLWSFPLGPDSPSTTVLFTGLRTWIPTRFPHIYADSYNIGLCFFFPPSHLPPYPIPLGGLRAQVWVPWVI